MSVFIHNACGIKNLLIVPFKNIIWLVFNLKDVKFVLSFISKIENV